MANIKLKDHYWETEGIYDAALSKTQKAINADIAEVAQNNSDLIIMSNTQPAATGNKIWIKEGVSYQIPVMDDLISNNITNNSSVTGTKVTDALNTLGSNVSSLQGDLNTLTNTAKGRFDLLYSRGSGASFISGELQVPNMNKYRLYLFVLTGDIMLICIRFSNLILGGFTTLNYNSDILTSYGCNYAFNTANNTLSINSDRRGFSNGTTSNFNGNTIAPQNIYGILAN